MPPLMNRMARLNMLGEHRLRGLADEELMVRLSQGDADAFDLIYERHADAAFSLAYRISGSRAAAEEVAQDAFLALWRNGGRYEPSRGSVRNWILGIVHNRAIDALRRAVRHDSRRAGDEGLAERLMAPDRTDEEVGRRQDAGTVRTLLDDLPGDQRRVIELAYFAGFTHTEIADMLAIPVGTVKGRMRLGLEKLRLRMEISGVTI
ncbi:MAG TPA: sigma-70 family RNA polymerase sigma factor [Solirubrobacteraceae bacterium]|jgi:RNA polymerase sigma-70 factor (ECF subfamily)|nr:sigma-70 family RNA polymerase sigma factor [Solirubrobacteraceae bacterium]